ncbi:MAG: zinc transporter ZntB [Woeseiaceae bacterium]|nr:zinc transporter ZntB [Woeseiaceae bacterium]
MTNTQTPKFLHCLLLDGEGGAKDVAAEDVDAWKPDDGVLWVHLDVNEPAASDWLERQDNIPEFVIEALLAGESRPWTTVADDSLLANLRGVNTNPGSDPEDMVSVRVWIDAHRIISSRRRRLLSVVDIVELLRQGQGPRNASECFAQLVERLSERIGEFVDNLELKVDGFENSIDSANLSALRRQLSETRREIAAVRRFLSPQRDALDRMNRRRPAILSDDDAVDLLQEADRITRFLEDLDLARERIVVLQEELIAQIAQQQNSRMYVLSIVAAIFLPLTFVTGMLGMNVGGLPGLESPLGFYYSVIIMVAAAFALLLYFRWKKWL